ncbi:MAG: hypothetical protein FWE06_07920 [Oscillospiraceae bacterium]|nr:hypothetical protein [Oscillospiraceae bacterium]
MEREFLTELGVDENAVEKILEAWAARSDTEAQELESLREERLKRPRLVLPPCGAVNGSMEKSANGVL